MMNRFAFPGANPFSSYPPIVSADQRASVAPIALPPEMLEHGAYYAGKLNDAPAIARWHAKKRRFVLAEYTLGRRRIRSVAHAADSGTAERFTPLAKTEPRNTSRLSDYAFETA